MTDQPPLPQQVGLPAPGPVLPKAAYTSWLTRVLAFLIDNIPVFVLTGISWGVAFANGDTVCAASDSGYGDYCSTSPSGLGLTIAVLAWLVGVVYLVWNYGYRQGATGSSIGKSILKFQVVSENSWQPIGFGMSLVRQLAHILDALVCYIGYLWPLWDAKRQTFADKIAKTVCVPSNPVPPGPTSYH